MGFNSLARPKNQPKKSRRNTTRSSQKLTQENETSHENHRKLNESGRESEIQRRRRRKEGKGVYHKSLSVNNQKLQSKT